MPQQINLCTPILLTQKRYFSAHTMAVALGVFLLLGGILCGVWVWNLDQGTAVFRQTGIAQTREVESLKAAIERSKASAAPVDPALLAQLQSRRTVLAQREKLREALKEGMFRPGWGHSDRLSWVARSIPAPVWITDVKMDGVRFEVAGFTLEPPALNDWVDQLAASPLMQGLKLSAVKVENATLTRTTGAPGAAAPASVASASTVPPRPVWSFNLVSTQPVAVAAVGAASAPGVRP
jgi:Tfp pilus assembly protein PilN